MTRLLSASRLPLLEKCAYTARPDVKLPVEAGSSFASRGNARHSLFEALHETRADVDGWASRVTPECGVADPAAFCDRFMAWLVNAVPPHACAEVPFAWQPSRATARVLPSKGQRDYSAVVEGEMVGTADMVWTDDDYAVVLDWKTGRAKHVDPATRNLQMGFLALCAARVWRLDRARVILAYVDDAGAVTTDEAEYDRDGLADVALRVGRVFFGSVSAPAVAGPHCRAKFCALMGLCPATRDDLAAIITAPPPDTTALACTSHEQAAALVIKAGIAETWAERARAVAKGFTDQHGPVAIGDGKVWGPRESRRESVRITPAGASILAERLGEYATLAAEPTATKSSITKAAKAAGIDPRPLFDALRECGDIVTTTTTVYEESATP